ncbi:MAG TPA: tetratricopeptide repeat protein [Gammaproteobacteria bacterium]|nr:tetratricopeptide repeat protein [Gammaproteobacteria bacterium]
MTISPYIFDLKSTEFDELVLVNSDKGPVLVNFWSAKAAPCMMLMPRLVKLCSEYQGRFLLGMVNTDEETDLVKRLGISSLPYVRIYKKGEVVETIRGAESEKSLRQILAKHIPQVLSPLHTRAIKQVQTGKTEEALQLMAEAVVETPNDVRIPADMLRLLIREGRFVEAEKLAYSIPQSIQNDPSISLLMTHLEIFNASPEDDESSIEAINMLYKKLNEEEVCLNVRLELASRLLKIDDIERSLEQLYKIRQKDRAFRNNLGHRGMLALFSLLGNSGEVYETYRKKIMT